MFLQSTALDCYKYLEDPTSLGSCGITRTPGGGKGVNQIGIGIRSTGRGADIGCSYGEKVSVY